MHKLLQNAISKIFKCAHSVKGKLENIHIYMQKITTFSSIFLSSKDTNQYHFNAIIFTVMRSCVVVYMENLFCESYMSICWASQQFLLSAQEAKWSVHVHYRRYAHLSCQALNWASITNSQQRSVSFIMEKHFWSWWLPAKKKKE